MVRVEKPFTRIAQAHPAIRKTRKTGIVVGGGTLGKRTLANDPGVPNGQGDECHNRQEQPPG